MDVANNLEWFCVLVIPSTTCFWVKFLFLNVGVLGGYDFADYVSMLQMSVPASAVRNACHSSYAEHTMYGASRRSGCRPWHIC